MILLPKPLDSGVTDSSSGLNGFYVMEEVVPNFL